MKFSPIAIVGQGCVLPGALSPDALWSLVREGRSALAPAGSGRWRIDADADRKKLQREISSDIGGHVEGFEAVWNAEGFRVDAAALRNLDPVFLWTLHAAREALRSAGLPVGQDYPRASLVIGNLSYPTPGLVDLALETWAEGAFLPGTRDARNRFMSGLPAHLAAEALGFGGGAYAIDAACASSLYAIKLACERLQDGIADLALAGGVNHADDLFLHGGFSALQALSPSGQSRPFHRDADGLVPAQGAALLLLERLEDAQKNGHRILGVIRGVGLSNDGRSRGLMVPSEEGQIRALRAAYTDSGLSPQDISLVECHATGTVVGDGAEVRSMRAIFEGVRDLPLGSLKSNVGHLITASGAAAVIKVLAAMREKVRPPTRHAEAPIDELADGMFRLLAKEEPWEAPADGAPRRAAISNFGFGGNNAHLILEEWVPPASAVAVAQAAPKESVGSPSPEIAIIALAVQTGNDVTPFAETVLGLSHEAASKVTSHVDLDAAGLRFPPNDLRATLPQQTQLLALSRKLDSVFAKLPHERTTLLTGMQCDAEIARHAVRWCGPRRWVDVLPKELADQPLTAASVVGCMPNIVANRLSHQFDIKGPSYSVCSEELSGIVALEQGARALRSGEADAAVIGAVDFASEPVQAAAARVTLGAERATPGDAAVILIMKRHADALRDGDKVLALLAEGTDETPPSFELNLTAHDAGLTPRFGHAHAASGLLHLAAAIVACSKRAVPSVAGPMPWLPAQGTRKARVHVDALGGQSATVEVSTASGSDIVPVFLGTSPVLGVFSARDVAGLVQILAERAPGHAPESTNDASCTYRLAITGESPAEFETRVAEALAFLRANAGHLEPGPLGAGIYFGEGAIQGELGFVFTGAAGAYPGMGRDLALAFPDLVDQFVSRAKSVREAAGWVYTYDESTQATPMEKLWGASYLAQLHTELTRGLFGLRPTASIGYCSGETNSLFALGAWGDLDGFRDAISESHVYDRWLCGELECLRPAWNLGENAPAEWSTWRMRVPVEEVRTAVASEPRAHLVIINSKADVVVAGEPEACARVAAQFGRRAARTPGYDFIMHCPEAREYEDRWRALHTRPTVDVPGVRFYTHATRTSYRANMQNAADALTGQAMNLVDFPALIERAYADGVRVFIEHGPHAGCTKWIGDILGARPHLAIALDRYGHSSLMQAVEAAAQLYAAGVPVHLGALQARLRAKDAAPLVQPTAGRSLALHLPGHPVAIPAMPSIQRQEIPMKKNGSSDVQGAWMAPPPTLAKMTNVAPVRRVPPPTTPSVPASHPVTPTPMAAQPANAPAMAAAASADAPAALAAPTGYGAGGMSTTPFDHLAAHNARLAELHQAFLRQQIEIQSHFVNMTFAPLARWTAGAAAMPPGMPPSETTPRALVQPIPHAPAAQVVAAPAPRPVPITAPTMPAAAPLPTMPAAAPLPTMPAAAPLPTTPAAAPLSTAQPVQTQQRAVAAKIVKGPALQASPAAAASKVTKVPPPRKPTGPSFDRAGLQIHASGEISKIFGELFKQQDGYARQVRMPEPPLLLADRVLGIEGEAGGLGLGTIWTETDVVADAFYLHEGRMPAGILVESGQADLMLISWLGADFLNKGDRVYRLLGCELKAHGELPKIGDTLHYEILVDGHAEQNGIRLFFFHYNCWVNGELRVSVRSGQAGFFTDEELAGSAGVLWSPETATPKENPRLDPPHAICTRRSFSAKDLDAMSEGRIADCFGPEFHRASAHTRTPTIAAGRMRLLDEVTSFEPNGGPWKRGYLRANLALTPDKWFFQGHFKNDPCMPGTLMLEGGLQAMQILMTALGHTLDHDGSRFEPIPEENYSLRCRGQATPVSKEVVYEIFVEEVIGGAMPMIYADILGSVDGRKAFHCKRMGLRIVPAWPLDSGRLEVEIPDDPRPVAVVDGFRFDYASLLACAWGIPSSAFGPMYKRFDGTRRVARLPGPPYHFMSRVSNVQGPIGGMQVGSIAEIEYDVPENEWYFTQNNAPAMPFPVLLETALQPCGWLASYVGGALDSEDNLYFRNLDGTGTQHVEVRPLVGTVKVTTKLTSISKADAIVIMGFDVTMHAGSTLIYSLKTVFGFFPGDTMKDQAGLPMTPALRAKVAEPNDFRVELADRPARYFAGSLSLPVERLVMIDRITGYWPSGESSGAAGLGRLRAEKDVAASEWFFKAHFYQDPVQPGSLGIEALLQALQALVIERDLGRGVPDGRFETQATGVTMSWKYRGQVIPDNHVVVVDVEITEVKTEGASVVVVAEGSLWVDGKRIYEAKGLGVRIVPGANHTAN